MWIKRLNITHFGRFYQKQLSFNPGINVIYGENESGKSTVHQFIQAMLFGVERLRGKAARRDVYTKFQPWEQGRSYEGSMEIEHDGERYRLVRNFYKEDEFFRVEQLSTGKEINLPGNEIDTLIDGLNRSNFKNTLSISQLESQIDMRFGLSLQAYMANIQKTKSQEVDLNRTFEFLKKAKKVCLDKSPEKQLREQQNIRNNLAFSESEEERLSADIRELEKELERVREKIQFCQSDFRENRRKEQKERMAAVRLIEENNAIASRYRELKSAYEQMKCTMPEDNFEDLKQKWDEANEDYEDLADQYDQISGRNLATLFSIAMFGIIPVAAVFFLKSNMFIRFGVIVAFIGVLLLTSFILQRGRRHLGIRLKESKENLQDIHDQMEQQMFGRGNQERLSQMKEELDELREQYEKIQIPLKPYIEKYGDDISLETDDVMDNQSFGKLRNEEERLMKSLERLIVQKENFEQRMAEREDLELEIKQLAEEVKSAKEEAGIIQECMDILYDLSEEIHSDFGHTLNREVSDMICQMTGGKYTWLTVDNELNIKVDTGSGFAEPDQLSVGTREQIYLALRAAMVKLLFPEGNMPLILDDSFGFYDDKRLLQTLEWLSEQNFEQILLFTCQTREMSAFEQLGVPYTSISLNDRRA